MKSSDIEEIKAILNKVKLDMYDYNRNGVFVNNADDFSNIVSLVINTPLLIHILKYIGPNATWDAIKMSSIFAWKKARGKYITKVFSGGRTEEKPVTIGIEVNINPSTNYNFRFEGLNTEKELSVALKEIRDKLNKKKTD